MSTKKVCLDAGHDASNVNQSPDGSFYEHEFTLDMAKRMEAVLQRHGVVVTLTRTGGEAVNLEERVKIANSIPDLNLFVSLHSNAAGGEGWSSAAGWSVYTSVAGAAAQRNIAANAVISAVEEAGVATRSPALWHERFYVLRNTVAPAILLEQGFHTNEGEVALLKSAAYRKLLAEAQCKGILSYLGIPWQETPTPEPDNRTPSPWAAEDWYRAVALGLFDGSRPREPLTREMAAVLLGRLGILD